MARSKIKEWGGVFQHFFNSLYHWTTHLKPKNDPEKQSFKQSFKQSLKQSFIMVTGYFHWKRKNEVLTAYYEIDPQGDLGHLLFSSSLWKRQKDMGDHNWNRKHENQHAFENFLRGPVEVLFDPSMIGQKKVDSDCLRRFIYTQLTGCSGRQCRTFRDDGVAELYKSPLPRSSLPILPGSGKERQEKALRNLLKLALELYDLDREVSPAVTQRQTFDIFNAFTVVGFCFGSVLGLFIFQYI